MSTTTTTALDQRRWFGMAMLGLGVSLIIVDATIVNVAVPTIIEDLHINLGTAEWINSIYSLVFAALLITLGRLGDLYGRKRLFLTGLNRSADETGMVIGYAPHDGLA
jgi:MFS family permease